MWRWWVAFLLLCGWTAVWSGCHPFEDISRYQLEDWAGDVETQDVSDAEPDLGSDGDAVGDLFDGGDGMQDGEVQGDVPVDLEPDVVDAEEVDVVAPEVEDPRGIFVHAGTRVMAAAGETVAWEGYFIDGRGMEDGSPSPDIGDYAASLVFAGAEDFEVRPSAIVRPQREGQTGIVQMAVGVPDGAQADVYGGRLVITRGEERWESLPVAVQVLEGAPTEVVQIDCEEADWEDRLVENLGEAGDAPKGVQLVGNPCAVPGGFSGEVLNVRAGTWLEGGCERGPDGVRCATDPERLTELAGISLAVEAGPLQSTRIRGVEVSGLDIKTGGGAVAVELVRVVSDGEAAVFAKGGGQLWLREVELSGAGIGVLVSEETEVWGQRLVVKTQQPALQVWQSDVVLEESLLSARHEDGLIQGEVVAVWLNGGGRLTLHQVLVEAGAGGGVGVWGIKVMGSALTLLRSRVEVSGASGVVGLRVEDDLSSNGQASAVLLEGSTLVVGASEVNDTDALVHGLEWEGRLSPRPMAVPRPASLEASGGSWQRALMPRTLCRQEDFPLVLRGVALRVNEGDGSGTGVLGTKGVLCADALRLRVSELGGSRSFAARGQWCGAVLHNSAIDGVWRIEGCGDVSFVTNVDALTVVNSALRGGVVVDAGGQDGGVGVRLINNILVGPLRLAFPLGSRVSLLHNALVLNDASQLTLSKEGNESRPQKLENLINWLEGKAGELWGLAFDVGGNFLLTVSDVWWGPEQAWPTIASSVGLDALMANAWLPEACWSWLAPLQDYRGMGRYWYEACVGEGDEVADEVLMIGPVQVAVP